MMSTESLRAMFHDPVLARPCAEPAASQQGDWPPCAGGESCVAAPSAVVCRAAKSVVSKSVSCSTMVSAVVSYSTTWSELLIRLGGAEEPAAAV
eukprot:13542041-Heterocapsa_arctica.AAC.1